MKAEREPSYRFGDYLADTGERLLIRDGEVVPLTLKVFDTLIVLLENSGHLVEKEELMGRLWPDSHVDENNLTQNISLLRKALGDGQNGNKFIETVPRRGYRFIESVSVIDPDELRITEPSKVSSEATASESQHTDRPLRFLKQHKTWIAIAAGISLLAGAGLAWWLIRGGTGQKLAFQQRDWVLVTSFENRTGEDVFEGTLEYALERELGNSGFVFVAARERIEDALRLMKRPPNTKVDAAVGKEVCLRDGGIRALIAGRAEKLGLTYVLNVSLIDPATNQVVASTTEEAASQEQVAPAVRRLSAWAREVLGEALASIQQSNNELEKVTTPSLRALQLYTQGEARLRQPTGDAVAEQLFRQALIEDPEFASAHMMLAWAIRNQRKPEAEWIPSSERALELSERVSERERYFIQGSYYSMRRQDDKAVPIYEALLERYPDHYWGRNNLVHAYNRLRRPQEMLPHKTQAADQRPNDFLLQIDAATTANDCKALDQAMHYARRAKELITPDIVKSSPYAVVWVEFFLVAEPYRRDELEKALADFERMVRTIDGRTGRERDAFAHFASWGYLRFGKVRAAEELAMKVSPDDNRYFDLALIALTRGDKGSLRKHLLDHLTHSRLKVRVDAVPLLMRAGLLAEAEKLMSGAPSGDEAFQKVYRGDLALAKGKPSESIPLLREGINSLKSGGDFTFYYAAWDSLATAFEHDGDLLTSLSVLEEGCREKHYGGSANMLWLGMKARLAQMYRRLNRTDDARKVEAELAALLRYADADHPVLRQIQMEQSKEMSGHRRKPV